MSETALCWICDADFNPDNQSRYFKDHGYFGVCPTCRQHAEIGRRVEGMKPAEYPRGELADMMYEEMDEADGYNRCLREAKGEKP